MSQETQGTIYFIGWDVGGWNCDKNPRSRDAIVILDDSLAIVGTPWRGNLRQMINQAETTEDWIVSLFALCDAEMPRHAPQVTLAIDTPLGFSEPFVRLVTQLEDAGPVERSSTNPYLFRQTEHFLFEQGLSPLSAVKDMIGSQSTKGMHVLARFAPEMVECGVWSDGQILTAIEAYPSACKGSDMIQTLRLNYSSFSNEDYEDALTCALVAHLFLQNRDSLVQPRESSPGIEGWIWVPEDALEKEDQ